MDSRSPPDLLADQGGARLSTIGKGATRTARRHPIVLGKDDIRSCRQMLDSEFRLACGRRWRCGEVQYGRRWGCGGLQLCGRWVCGGSTI